RIAKKLDELGVDVIEAGSAIISEGEREAIKKIVKENLKAEICSFTRTLKEDVDAALECEVDSINLVVPVSDLHIKYKLGKDRDFVRERCMEIVEYAKEHGLIVEVSGEDGSRADIDFVESLFGDAVKVGADRICLCDTVGILTPEKSSEIFTRLSKIGVPVSAHCHNDFGLATANSIAALRSGAEGVHVTVNGIGERAGNASLEEIVMSLEVLYGVKTGISKEEIYQTSRLVSRLTGIPVSPQKPIVGENAFTHESGIHVHAIISEPSTYEPMIPEMIGRERRIVFGKHAGKKAIEKALKEMGIEADEDKIRDILKRVKELGDRGKKVTDSDIQTIAQTVLEIGKHQKIKLEDYSVVTGKNMIPTASIRLSIDDKEVIEAGTGIGPVDAVINALRKAIKGTEINLEEYHVEAITGGTDALVEVSVKLKKNGRIVSAHGARADIIMASVEAVIEGINRLESK
ncbi:MAG: 2-isopropylmalate synthase, partial [Candidatus Syntropharchaeia archaeon]